LNNALRKYGFEAFIVQLIEHCEISQLDEREQHFIKERITLFPKGYNLTTGGRHTRFVASSQLERSSLNPAGKHGGCNSRSEETRAKMSQRAKELVTPEFCIGRSNQTKEHHHCAKLERFKNCKIDLSEIELYIRKKGVKVIVIIEKIRAEFASKHETIEQLKDRARAFILEVTQRYQTAGSP
jgi:group I intron endonuclease